MARSPGASVPGVRVVGGHADEEQVPQPAQDDPEACARVAPQGAAQRPGQEKKEGHEEEEAEAGAEQEVVGGRDDHHRLRKAGRRVAGLEEMPESGLVVEGVAQCGREEGQVQGEQAAVPPIPADREHGPGRGGIPGDGREFRGDGDAQGQPAVPAGPDVRLAVQLDDGPEHAQGGQCTEGFESHGSIGQHEGGESERQGRDGGRCRPPAHPEDEGAEEGASQRHGQGLDQGACQVAHPSCAGRRQGMSGQAGQDGPGHLDEDLDGARAGIDQAILPLRGCARRGEPEHGGLLRGDA